MGNAIRHLSARATLIATDNTWIEGEAIQQLLTTSELPGMQSVAGLPDLHPGRGYPVGAAFFSTENFYPALVGSDIGCGMALWKTDLTLRKCRLEKLVQRLGNIDGPLDESWNSTIAAAGLPLTGFESGLGTIGGGNHFAELQQIDTVYDSAAYDRLGLSKAHALLLIHSGSRGLGGHILRQHIDQHGHHGLSENSSDAKHYLELHETALRYAALNRSLIAQRMLARWRSEGQCCVDLNHNLLGPCIHQGQSGWLHRKGATPADSNWAVIPGSRGDYSFLVKPKSREHSLYSLAHGAGRRWMRSECKARLSQRYSPAELSRTKLGSHVICHDKALIYEEAPEAYKSLDSVMEALLQADLIEPVARLKPLLTYKTAGGCGL
jgi:release factor H-coupled RctB family protein